MIERSLVYNKIYNNNNYYFECKNEKNNNK